MLVNLSASVTGHALRSRVCGMNSEEKAEEEIKALQTP